MAEVTYIQLPDHVKNMSEEDLREYFPEDISKSTLMRSIIMNEKEYSTIDYDRTLRSMWYSAVKPTLDKLGLLTSDDQTEEGLTRWDAILSRYTADLLRRGALTYKDLHIVDQSRQKENPSEGYYTVSNDTYGYKASIAPYSNIIIATEKDTVYNIISGIARLFGCSCISSKGQNALGAMEGLLRGMESRDSTIYILTMTDYDPAGYYIADALKKQVMDLVPALGMHWVKRVKIRRIGITPDQLSPEEVQANKYTPKPANMDKWFEMTNGIDGEPKGLELDALSPDQIREIFVDNMTEFIDTEVYDGFIRESYIKSRVLRELQPYVDKITAEISAAVLDNLELDNYDIADLAKQGYSRLPIGSLCKDTQDMKIWESVRDIMNNGVNIDE